jgi:hypothetical protein
MKLTYAVSMDDYRNGQVPFTLKAGHNPGFKAAMAFCVLIGGLGVFTFIQDMGIPVSAFLVGLGLVAAVAAYTLEKHTVGIAKKKYDANIAAGYQRLHCHDQRVFETTETGFTATCRCGSVTRPWAELISFSENEKLLVLNTKMGAQVLPKSAFPNTGDLTEFRGFVLSKLNQDRPLTSRHVEFACHGEDFRQARLLHILKGGGWRGLAKQWAMLIFMGYGAWAIWDSMKHHDRLLLCVMLGALLSGPALRIMKERHARYLGPLRIDFSEDGLHLQDRTTQARGSWSQFIGYLESSHVLLLYYNPKLYRIIPKRALTGPGADFRCIVTTKLQPYNYRQLTFSSTASASDLAQG